ncbi:Acyl-CoA desaturase [Takifugu flavidus]|uniref:stearoyl-CoA 9-desaturase n=1 Tax=Takifugu flavidus TaxID=433684 RepID=A0A5C6PR18_9TELE|nr:Acyl-CoA desaturase [Takifugu flavidus]
MTETEALEKKQHRSKNGDVHPEAIREDEFDHTYREKEGPKPAKIIVWKNVILMALLHLSAVYAIFLIPSASALTLLWLCLTSASARTRRMISLSGPETTGFTTSIQRQTPTLTTRCGAFSLPTLVGFWCANTDVIEKGRKLNVSDLLADEVVQFQRKYYKQSVLLACFLIPTFVPWYMWGESLWVAYFIPAVLRYTLVLNATWLVNSAAHMWGNRPYDNTINPRENKYVAFGAIGEGFHNYHHSFPYDYATSEFGCKLNLTTCFIDLMCYLGLATDRKKVSREVILARAQRTGDGSHRSG